MNSQFRDFFDPACAVIEKNTACAGRVIGATQTAPH
jgi:hypothetical protein